jgi:hypothetical protein
MEPPPVGQNTGAFSCQCVPASGFEAAEPTAASSGAPTSSKQIPMAAPDLRTYLTGIQIASGQHRSYWLAFGFHRLLPHRFQSQAEGLRALRDELPAQLIEIRNESELSCRLRPRLRPPLNPTLDGGLFAGRLPPIRFQYAVPKPLWYRGVNGVPRRGEGRWSQADRHRSV